MKASADPTSLTVAFAASNSFQDVVTDERTTAMSTIGPTMAVAGASAAVNEEETRRRAVMMRIVCTGSEKPP